MLPDEKWNEQEKYTKETEKTLTIVYPFLKGDLQISQIYELYPLQKTEVLPETKTVVLNLNVAGENDEFFKEKQ